MVFGSCVVVYESGKGQKYILLNDCRKKGLIFQFSHTWEDVFDPLRLRGHRLLVLLDAVRVDDGHALVGVGAREALRRGVRDHRSVVDADGVGRLEHLAEIRADLANRIFF